MTRVHGPVRFCARQMPSTFGPPPPQARNIVPFLCSHGEGLLPATQQETVDGGTSNNTLPTYTHQLTVTQWLMRNFAVDRLHNLGPRAVRGERNVHTIVQNAKESKATVGQLYDRRVVTRRQRGLIVDVWACDVRRNGVVNEAFPPVGQIGSGGHGRHK